MRSDVQFVARMEMGWAHVTSGFWEMSSVIYYSLCIAGARANGTKPILTGKLSSYNNCQGSLLIISNSLFPRLLPPSLHRPAPGDVSLKVWRAEASMGLRLFSDALRDLEDLCCVRPNWTEVRSTMLLECYVRPYQERGGVWTEVTVSLV